MDSVFAVTCSTVSWYRSGELVFLDVCMYLFAILLYLRSRFVLAVICLVGGESLKWINHEPEA